MRSRNCGSNWQRNRAMVDLNPRDDRLESELASFRPRPLAPQLRERIGNELRGRRSRRMAGVIGLAAAVAACVAGGVAIWPHRTPPAPVVAGGKTSAGAPSAAPASAGAA